MKDAEIIELIKIQGTATRGLMISEINRIEEMDRKRNGSIKENKDEIKKIKEETLPEIDKKIDTVKKDTRIFRWASRNPKLALAIFAMCVLLVFAAYNALNVHRTVEKILKIELKDEQTSSNSS